MSPSSRFIHLFFWFGFVPAVVEVTCLKKMDDSEVYFLYPATKTH